MVLTKQSSGGKYLSKEWNDPDRERQRCLHDQRGYSTADRAYYEVTGTGIRDGLGYMLDDACQMWTDPIDQTNRKPVRYDQRDKPEVGW